MADTTVLTVKQTRRKRPSFSPRKTGNDDFGHYDSSLEFDEFFLLDEPVGSQWHDPLFHYLQARYLIQDMWVMQPFLVLRCIELPDPVERPFTISGCLAVWLHIDEPVPAFLPGQFGGESDFERFVEVEKALSDNWDMPEIPKPESLLSILLSHFPDAIAISSIMNTIIVEFPEVSQDAWAERLERLPWAFKNLPNVLKYSNGPLADTEFKRAKAPNPRLLTSVVDDTDYICMANDFNPGALICSDQDEAVTAGILVQKDSETRLTVAFHCWDREYEADPSKLGDLNSFRVRQADSTVGHMLERIHSTDIGLAKLNNGVSFSNRFLDVNTAAKVLLHSSQVKPMEHIYIDSFVTGRQPLLSVGCRVLGKAQGEDVLRNRQENPPDGPYVVLHQGIYATNEPEILGTPKLRAGICGSVLVRARRANEKSSCLEDGEVCGIMHWADLAMKCSTEAKYYCFADPVDPLIDDGWSCVPVAEKHANTEDDPPAKRSKL